MRKIPWVVVAFAMIATLAGFTSPASASTDDGAVYKTASVSVSASDITVKAVNVKKVKGAIEVRWVMPKGLPKRQQEDCVTVRQAGKVYRIGGESFRIGQKYYTDYRDSNGRQIWHWKKVQKGDKFCLVQGKVIRQQCGNQATKTEPPVVAPKIKVVKKFSTKVRMVVKVKASAKGTGSASVLCSIGGDWSTASTSLSLYASVRNKFFVRASSKYEAKAKVQRRGHASLRQQVKVKAEDKARVAVSGDATAECALKLGVKPPSPNPCPPGSVWNPETGTCAKDGSTTPPPPPIAPGPNPQPTPGPGDYQSAACWWEDTGLPVAPADFWLNPATQQFECPIGSWGTIIYP